MRKLKLLSAALSLSLLAGCTQTDESVTETEFSVPESEITSSQATEISEEITEAETTVAEEETETVLPEAVVIPEEPVPDGVRLFEYNSETPPEMPEFPMSLEDMSEYDRHDISRVRFSIMAMLECAETGEIPYIKYNGVASPSHRLENIRISGWEVVEEKNLKGKEYDSQRHEVTVRMNVTESSVDEVPVGTADYLFIYYPGEDRSFLPLRKAGELDESPLLPTFDREGENKAVSFCNDFTAYFSGLFEGDDVTDFSSPDVSIATPTIFYAFATVNWYHPCSSDFEGLKYDTFDNALKEMYGFSAETIKTKQTDSYDEETDTISVPGRGISWLCGYLADKSYDEETRTHTITIDYYEDDFHLVKSQTYRYTVRENDNGSLTMLRMERLFKSDRGILGGCV